MALVPFYQNDFFAESEEIITTQFSDKVIFQKYLRLLKLSFQEILEVERQLIQERDIDSAIGKQLDIIGDIVGQPRTLADADLYQFFGFQGALAAESFGTQFNPGIGGYWWSAGTRFGADVVLTDDDYRKIIKAKIIKNNSRGTNEDYIKFGLFVLNAPIDFGVDIGANSVALVRVGRRMTLFERALMSYVFEGVDYNFTYTPKPLGVGIQVEEYDAIGTLGFLGTPGARGMISLSYPVGGGVFADAYFL